MPGWRERFENLVNQLNRPWHARSDSPRSGNQINHASLPVTRFRPGVAWTPSLRSASHQMAMLTAGLIRPRRRMALLATPYPAGDIADLALAVLLRQDGTRDVSICSGAEISDW